jgi:hypothetical protein
MKKSFFLAAMSVMAVSAFAQNPTIKYVRSIEDTDGAGGIRLGAGWNPAASLVVGDQMFYTGWNGTAFTNAFPGTIRLMRVTNWQKDNMVFDKYAEETDARGGARNSNLVLDESDPSRFFWGYNLGEGFSATQPFAKVRRVKVNGTPLTDYLSLGTDALADGIVDVTEIQPTVPGQWSASNITPMAISFDPGFGASPTPALAWNVFNTAMVRRVDLNTGRMILADGVMVYRSAVVSNGVRGAVFAPNGDMYGRNDNRIIKHDRTEQGQTTTIAAAPPNPAFLGFNAQTVLPTALAVNANTGNNSLTNICRVPGVSGEYDPFFVVNDRQNVTPQPRQNLWINEATGTTFLTQTGGAFSAPLYTTNVQATSTAVVGGTRYIFVAGFKGSTQGVDVYQVGNDGNVAGTVNLLASAATQQYRVIVRLRNPALALSDPAGIWDTRAYDLPLGQTSLSYNFNTAIKENVNVTCEVVRVESTSSVIAGGYVRRAVLSQVPGATPITANFTLENGNIDNDTEVGPGDLQLVLDNFGLTSADPGWDPVWDMDDDGEVGPGDLQNVLDFFGVEGDF